MPFPKTRSVRVLPAAVVIAAFAGLAPASASEVTITISNFAFSPETVTVAKGDTVIFVNEDDTIHSVVADDGSFHSDGLDSGDKARFVLAAPGKVAYHCGLHPFMSGAIVVQ